ncbi:hypothetical protein ACWCQZ_44760 [Streptomyces sp. NPDC002285]
MDVHVRDHFPDRPAPEWMNDLLDALLTRRLTGEAVRCPEGYPDGENGLMNILLDLEREFPLGIEDEGEATFWPMPQIGLALLIGREGGTHYVVRPWEGTWQERLQDGRAIEGRLAGGRSVGRWRFNLPDGGVYEHDYGDHL